MMTKLVEELIKVWSDIFKEGDTITIIAATIALIISIPFIPFYLILEYYKNKKIKKSIYEDEFLSEVVKLLDSYGLDYELDTYGIRYTFDENNMLDIHNRNYHNGDGGHSANVISDRYQEEVEIIRNKFGDTVNIHSYKKLLEIINPDIIKIDRDKKLNDLI